MIDPFSSAGYEMLVSYFLNVGAKCTLVLVAVLCVDLLLDRRRVLVRSTLWHASLAALALLPLATLCLPRLALSWPAPRVERSVAERPGVEVAPLDPAATVTSPPGEHLASTTIFPAEPAVGWEPAVVLGGLIVYLFGSAVLLVRFAVSLRAVAVLRAEPVEDEGWNALAAQWSQRLGVTRRVRLLVSPEVSVPVQVGWLRPSILLPPTVAASTDEATRAAVLVHELAHIRRGDYGWNLLLQAVLVLYWPHPLAWFAGRRIGQLREQACDELCVHWLKGVYRCRLIDLAAHLLSRRPIVSLGMAMSQPTRLARRLAWIDASSGRPTCVQSAPARRAIILTTLCLTGLLGAASMSESAADDQPADTKKAEEPAQQPETKKKSSASKPPSEANDSNTKGPAESTEERRAANSGESGKADRTAEDKPVRVLVERVKRQDLAVEAAQPCTLTAGRTSEVYARSPGFITRMTVDAGDQVKTGQVLAEIEPSPSTEVIQAESQVAESEAGVQKAEAVVVERKAELEAAKADVETAEANLEGAAVNLVYREKQQVRIKHLADSGQIDAALVDEQEEKLSAAKVEVKGAKSALESAKRLIPQREAAIVSAQATAKVAAVQLRAAQGKMAELKKSSQRGLVVSPFDGVVVHREFQPGDFVGGPGKTPLFTVVDLRRMTAVTQMPERAGLAIKRGDAARIFIDALPGKVFSAKVSRVAYQIDPKTRTLQVDLALNDDNSDRRLLPGLYGVAAVTLAVHRDVLSIPLSACHGSTVRAIVGGHAVQKEVETGAQSFDRVEILSGLQEGDVVITRLLSHEQEEPDWRTHPQVEIVEPDRTAP